MRIAVLLGVLIGAFGWPGSVVEAQFRRRFNIGGNDDDPARVTSKIDHDVQANMDEAQAFLKQEQYLPAVLRLQSVLDHPEDFFLTRDFPLSVAQPRRVSTEDSLPPTDLPSSDRSASIPRLKARTHRILAELPAEARATYELQFGLTARSLLNAGIQKRSFEQIAEIARRYQSTAAGFDALHILATTALDLGQYLEAAVLCETMASHPAVTKETKGPILLKAAFAWYLAGDTQTCVALLGSLKGFDTSADWKIGERPLAPLPSQDEMPRWLLTNFGAEVAPRIETVHEWESPRGGATGNESATVAYPVGGIVWSVSPLEHLQWNYDPPTNQRLKKQFDLLVRYIEGAFRDHNQPIHPAAIPVIVRDQVIFRTLNDVTAVSLKTGRLLWRSAVTDGWFAENLPTDFSVTQSTTPTKVSRYVQAKLFRDQLAGTLTSDGRLLFAIEESDLYLRPLRAANPRQEDPWAIPPTNKLVAYDVENGRIVWEAGGTRGCSPAELSGLYFLGPPLVFDGRLFCLVERKGELCLLSLIVEDNSVRMEWSQTLIRLNSLGTRVSLHRQVGLTPVISNGIMICPTATGSVVAYDLVLRQLRWGFSYESNRSDDLFESCWLDRGPVIANGYVVLTSADSREIVCLKQCDGALAWNRSRRQGTYVACVHDNAVIVVGRTQLIAYSLTKGTEIWSKPLEIPESSGRGVRIGSQYLLPLSNGQIATIDLSSGQILARSSLPDGRIPGNLAVREGTLVSCGIHDVVSFRSQSEVEQQIANLTTNPQDAIALALRGEERLHEGKSAEGINDLRESLRLRPDLTNRRRLAETLLNTLSNDRTRFLQAAPELETLAVDPKLRCEFWKSYIRFLIESGDRVAAVKQLFRFAELPNMPDELITDSSGYSISQRQSIRSQLLLAYESASPEQKIEIDSVFQREFEAAWTSKGRDRQLMNFAQLTLHHPLAEPLLKQMLESKELIIEETDRLHFLESLIRSSNKSISAYAIASLAENALNQNSPRDAIPWISQLQRDYPTDNCLRGRTGQQLSEEWLALKPVREAVVIAAKWPDRTIRAEMLPPQTEQSAVPVAAVTHVGSFFNGWTFEIDTHHGLFKAYDPSLHVVWQLHRAGFRDDSRVPSTQLHIRDRKMALTYGSQLIVMECGESATAPKVLFEESLQSNRIVNKRTSENAKEFNFKRPLLPTGRRFPVGLDGFLIGLSDEAVIYRLDERLIAANADNGDVLWSRMNPEYVNSDATVDKVLTLHTVANGAVLVRPLDGTVLQEHKGNSSETPLWFRGTLRLSQRDAIPEKRVFEMRDFQGNRLVWQSRHPSSSVMAIIEGREAAVLEPTGKLSVVSLETGAAIISAEIPLLRPDKEGCELAVQRFGDRYLVVAGIHADRLNLRPNVRTFGQSSDSTSVISGCVCAINRNDGQVAWSVPFKDVAYDLAQPTELPVLVLAARQSVPRRFDQPASNKRLVAMVIDKRSGKIVYESQMEPLSLFSQADRDVQYIREIEREKVMIDFHDSNLELSFPTEAKIK